MLILVTILHVLICLFLIIVVLLQSGKAADLAGAFGGMGSQTAFGPRGAATVLSKATTIAAALFMVTSMTLSVLATRRGGVTSTVLERQKPATKQTQTTQPGQPAQTPQPSVTFEPEGAKQGEGVTQPLQVPPAPAQEQKKSGTPKK